MSGRPYDTGRRVVKATWPSQHAEAGSLRSDALRTRGRLLQAAGELLAAEAAFTLSDVAAAAGVSPATAYRHFESADHVAFSFVAGFLDDVEHRTVSAAVQSDEPEQRLRALCRIWVETVLDWGPALAHLRSPEGFLARRARREPEVTRSLRHIEPALAALLPSGATPAELAYAVAVWNALADPREVLDQHAVLGWPARRIADHLLEAVLALARHGDARLVGQHDRLDAVAQAELHQQPGDVGLDRGLARRSARPRSRRWRARARRSGRPRARARSARRGPAGAWAASGGGGELLDQPAGDRGRQQRLALRDDRGCPRRAARAGRP